MTKSFPIQALVALLIIASTLTSSVNAAAIAPAFARDLRRDSVPAPMMARHEIPGGLGDGINIEDHLD
ncbi:hypothetical protein BGY98DRAFT_998011 [Russula aff. rugulosa BPL654]|nr:hypothetical protein BGY98DRAFT_998011 [Russula aff. rugulosa BPL654]